MLGGAAGSDDDGACCIEASEGLVRAVQQRLHRPVDANGRLGWERVGVEDLGVIASDETQKRREYR
jgi:hypothetical protein